MRAEPPFCAGMASMPVRSWFAHIWMFRAVMSMVGIQARNERGRLFGRSNAARPASASQSGTTGQ